MDLDTTDINRPWMLHSIADEVDDTGLEYSFDWSAWLTAASDTISGFVCTASHSGVTLGTPTHSAGVVTVFVSCDSTAEGQWVRITNNIETTGGRTDSRSIWLKVVQR